MKAAAAFGAIALLALAGCDEGGGPSATSGQAGVKKAGQMCLLTVEQCQTFATQSDALLPVLELPAQGRSSKDNATVQLVYDTFVKSQAVADQSCTPASGTLERKARIVAKDGQTAVLMGRGSDVCTLIRAN